MVQPTTHLGCVAYPIAPRLQASTACHCTKQHRLNQAQEKVMQLRCGKDEMWKAATDVTWYTILQQFF